MDPAWAICACLLVAILTADLAFTKRGARVAARAAAYLLFAYFSLGLVFGEKGDRTSTMVMMLASVGLWVVIAVRSFTSIRKNCRMHAGEALAWFAVLAAIAPLLGYILIALVSAGLALLATPH